MPALVCDANAAILFGTDTFRAGNACMAHRKAMMRVSTRAAATQATR